MQVIIQTIVTNSMAENAHVVCVKDTREAFVADPGGAADEIIEACEAQAVAELHMRTGAHIRIHPRDAAMLTDVQLSLGRPGIEQTQVEADCPLDVLESAHMNICGLDVEVIYTPGHTAGSVSYYLPEQKVLISGDTMFYEAFGRTDFPGGSAMQLRRSLRKLYTLPGETRVLPGHGPETTIEHEVSGR